MHLPLISTFVNATLLQEMAAMKLCPLCSKSMAANHYWYKGAWKCKGVLKTLPTGATAPTVPSVLAAPTTTPLIKSAVKAALTPPVAPAKPTIPTPLAKSTASSTSDFTTHAEVEQWLIDHKIKGYKIATDLSVSTKGNVKLMGLDCKILPVKFTSVGKNLLCETCQLETLINFPTRVGGDATLTRMEHLKSLEHFPLHVGGDIALNLLPIISLRGLPSTVNGTLHIHDTKITTLEGISTSIQSDVSLD